MRLLSPWQPRLSHNEGGPFDRLVSALVEDIADGALRGGDRLPPHRELAYQLGVGLGTVTKAYANLERRGLVHSVRGRGTFVTSLLARPRTIIDLSINTPPQMLSDRLLASSLMDVAKRLDAGTFGTYASPSGGEGHRAQAARWLASQRLDVSAERILLCNGAQHALSIAFASVCEPGGVLFTEAVTYPGAIMLARQNGYRLVGVDMDDEGIMPEALDAAFRAASGVSASRTLYVTPTLQNPTARTMGSTRRNDIVCICRDYDATIVEDDVYSIFAQPDLIPLATIAPERTLYVSGLSKTMSPGLRIGMLVLPPQFLDRAGARLQATSTMASPLACMIMEQWLLNGTAETVAASIRLETAKRHDMARDFLPLHLTSSSAKGFHIWLPMPTIDAERIEREAAARGVIVMAARAPLVDAGAANGGLRISLGGPDHQSLQLALSTLANILNRHQEINRNGEVRQA